MSSSTERRPSRLAKLNASDKIKDQMDHLLLLASGKAHLKTDNNDNIDGDEGGNGKEAIRPGRRKRRPADDLSDTERATTSTATITDASKRAQTRSKKQKADDGDSGGGEARHTASSIPAVEVKKKPKQPKKQQPSNDDTADQMEPSIPAEQVKKKPGRAKKQKTGDNDGEGSGRTDNGESSTPVEEPKRKPGRPKRHMATDGSGDAGHGESSMPVEEVRKKTGRSRKQRIGDNDTEDRPEPSTPTIEPKKRVGRLKKQQADGDKEIEVDHTMLSVPMTEEPKEKRVGRSKKQKADDTKETDADHPETTIPTDGVKKKQGRPKKQEAGDGDDGDANDEPSVPVKKPKEKYGLPKKHKEDRKSTNHVQASTAEPKRRQGPSLKQVEDMSDSDDIGPSMAEREVKTRGGRSKSHRQHSTIDDIQGNSSESDYKGHSTSGSDSDSDDNTLSNVQSRSNKKGKGRDKTGAEGSRVQETEKKRSKRELARLAKVARVQERARRKQEMLDAKAAKVKAKQEREAKKLKRARRSFLAIPVSVQLAHAAENMAFEATQQQPKRREMEEVGEDDEMEDLALYSSNLIYQVLRPALKGYSYRWPIREGLLHSVPESSFRNAANKLDDFEEYGLGFVEELTGVPKNEEDYSDTDTEGDGAGSNEDVHVSSSQEIDEQEDGGDQSAEETAMERKLRRNRTRYAERYRKGIPERIQDLDQVQKLTLSKSCPQAVRTPIGSDLSGFDQEDDLTRLQQRAIAFSAEDVVRKTLDRMTYVVRQGSLLRMPDFPSRRQTVEGGVYKTKYERGWDTVMTSAALAGVDDRILKKVSMRMQNLLSKSKNSYHHEADSEGGWTAVDDTINKVKEPSRKPLGVKEPVVDSMDPMDPAFDPQELSGLADRLRGEDNPAPEADVKQGQKENNEIETTSGLRIKVRNTIKVGVRVGVKVRVSFQFKSRGKRERG
ncbi:hypothetical protein BGZ97_000657 [Linnemannia gamsii]|uniref:Uncharacterized protein n=1 Tax=Linnemannia gamsii TaxID=64522 RepID=A0A9P6R009_9FUNG|nr:hypothetical protein BGZ97_000657 [Linnemannia gamsii]